MAERNISKLTSTDSVSEWFVPVLLLILLICLWFSPWLLGGKVLAPFDIMQDMMAPWRGNRSVPAVHNHFVTDAVTHHIPYRLLSAQAFHEDGYVGWNPLLFGGTPQDANTMVLNYEWSTQLHRFLSFWTAWHLGRMLQFLTAGCGMLLFLRGQGCNAGVALLGAVSYMLNSQFVAWIYFNPGLAGFCWMPWLLWALHVARDKSAKFLGVASVFLALALLGGTIQQSAFVLLVLACVWAGWLWDGPRNRLFAGRVSVAFVVIGILGAALAAFMLEPSIAAFFDNAATGHSRGGLEYPYGAWQPILNALVWPFTTFPFVLGSVQTLDLGKAFKHSMMALGFFGTVPVVLAVVSLFSRQTPMAAKLMILSGVFIPLTPLVGLLYHRINLLWILGGCWGACAWIAAADGEKILQVARWMWRGLGAAVSFWVVASIAIVFSRSWLEPILERKISSMASESVFGGFSEWMRMRTLAVFDYLCIWNPWQLAALTGLAFSIWGLAQLSSPSVLRRLIAALGVAAQLSLLWWQWSTWSNPDLPYEKPSVVQLLQRELGRTGRLAIKARPLSAYLLAPNMLMPAGVAINDGYDAIHPHGMKSPTGLAWDFPGVTHYLGRSDETLPGGWLPIWKDGDWVILRNPRPAFGRLVAKGGLETSLDHSRFHRPTLNTMEVAIPEGTVNVEVFSNWHRGWKWRTQEDESWKETRLGPGRGVEAELDAPVGSETHIFFRYDPCPPRWVISIVGGALLVVLVLVIFSRGCIKGDHAFIQL